MKQYFECEVCHKNYATAVEAEKCEAKHKEEAKRKEQLSKMREERENNISKLINEFVKDYGVYPKNCMFRVDTDTLNGLFGRLFF